MPHDVVTRRLVQAILEQYALHPFGTHGVSHWARVYENGLRLAALTGARARVVALFAVLHDARRTNEGKDLTHAPEGAAYAASVRGELFDLSDEDFDLLYVACAGHTSGLTQADVTVQTCWDADRLDLGRARITPDPERLCTPAARDPAVIAWANRRSRVRAVPDFVWQRWGMARSSNGRRERGHERRGE